MNTKDIFNVLPNSISNILHNNKEISGLQELRVKSEKPLLIYSGNREIMENYVVTKEDIKTILQRISNYSIYAFEEEIKQGYITIKGGHRVGICGSCVIDDSKIRTIKNVASLNIRICREILYCSNKIMKYIINNNDIMNTIIISPPKCGKTTLIRDITRNISDGLKLDGTNFNGVKVCVIDERSEIGACYNGVPQMNIGLRTDILDNCPKSEGIMMAIRSMSPDVIVCDEIGTYRDVDSIVMAMNSGVKLVTTIHGYDIEDLNKRPVFKDILENHVFDRAIVLSGSHGVGTVEYIYDFHKKEKLWRI